jgi:pimeloyl-ACP methyl ester carboxylesterase
MNAEINSNVVLAEYLASHGYIVASVSLLGSSEALPSQSRTPRDLETAVRDLEFAWAVLREIPTVDGTRLAVMGHSLGAVGATVFAARNGNTSALVGLDGTYGFEGSADVLTGALGFDKRDLRSAFLDLRRAEGEQQARLDPDVLRSLVHAERLLVNVRQMHHSDFTSFAMVADRFDVPVDPRYTGTGWDRRTAQSGYQYSCRVVLEFLNVTVKGEAGATARLDTLLRSGDRTHEERLAAVPVPPAPDEAAALVTGSGLDLAKEQFRLACAGGAVAACVDANQFNAYGYELLGQKRSRDAIYIFEIVVWAHPTLANPQDSLADGYLAAGNSEKARLALLKAIELAATDPTMNVAARDLFMSAARSRLEQLR